MVMVFWASLLTQNLAMALVMGMGGMALTQGTAAVAPAVMDNLMADTANNLSTLRPPRSTVAWAVWVCLLQVVSIRPPTLYLNWVLT